MIPSTAKIPGQNSLRIRKSTKLGSRKKSQIATPQKLVLVLTTVHNVAVKIVFSDFLLFLLVWTESEVNLVGFTIQEFISQTYSSGKSDIDSLNTKCVNTLTWSCKLYPTWSSLMIGIPCFSSSSFGPTPDNIST